MRAGRAAPHARWWGRPWGQREGPGLGAVAGRSGGARRPGAARRSDAIHIAPQVSPNLLGCAPKGPRGGPPRASSGDAIAASPAPRSSPRHNLQSGLRPSFGPVGLFAGRAPKQAAGQRPAGRTRSGRDRSRGQTGSRRPRSGWPLARRLRDREARLGAARTAAGRSTEASTCALHSGSALRTPQKVRRTLSVNS